jgi:uncharacterized protein
MELVLADQIKALIDLQKVDFEIHGLRKELAAYPELEKMSEASFEKKKANLKAAEENFKSAQKMLKEKEMDLGGKEEKIKKLQGQLYQLKSNKEYAAMELEIKGAKADNSLLEEEILRLMDTVDQTKAGVATEKELLSQEEKKFKAVVDDLKKKSADLQTRIQTEEEKRKTHTAKVDHKMLAQYDKILKGRDGLAIVPVVNQSCGGCHMGFPPQTVNEIQMGTKVIYCESCARIIYWPS